MDHDELEFRLARLEAREDARGIARTVIVLLALLAAYLIFAGVLKVDLAALHG